MRPHAVSRALLSRLRSSLSLVSRHRPYEDDACDRLDTQKDSRRNRTGPSDVIEKRAAFVAAQQTLCRDRLVVVDESCFRLGSVPRHGWAPRASMRRARHRKVDTCDDDRRNCAGWFAGPRSRTLSSSTMGTSARRRSSRQSLPADHQAGPSKRLRSAPHRSASVYVKSAALPSMARQIETKIRARAHHNLMIAGRFRNNLGPISAISHDTVQP